MRCNAGTFFSRGCIEKITGKQCTEKHITVLRHFGQCFQHRTDQLSIPLFSAVQYSADDTGVLTVCLRTLRLRNQELRMCLVFFSVGKDAANQGWEWQVFFCTRFRPAKA